MLSITSANPISVVQNGVTQVYNTWKVAPSAVPRLLINQALGTVSLTMKFSLWGVDPSGNPIQYVGPGALKTLTVDNILTDSVLGTPTTNFFAAIAAKAEASGVIS